MSKHTLPRSIQTTNKGVPRHIPRLLNYLPFSKERLLFTLLLLSGYL